MTDNDIIIALEFCSNDGCLSCPFVDECESPIRMSEKIMKNALNLINRQKAEIARLKKENV